MRNVQVLRSQHSIDSSDSDVASGFVRILVLDDDTEIISQLENALWVWPHKVSLVANVEEAVRLCQHLVPSAILISVDRNKINKTISITALRRRLQRVPIIAVVSQRQFVAPGKLLDQGADALLKREDAHRPTLHNLLMSVQRNPDDAASATRIHIPALALPWRQSEIIGSLICDITGSIVDANRTLATSLGYSSVDDLRGKNVLRDLLINRNDWIDWKLVAGDTSTVRHKDSGVVARNGQILSMQVEVFAAPNHPSHLQAVFVDQTELAVLTGSDN